ncbi:MAG: DUF3857 domain-containing protein [Gemmatimonadaceae bacterium]|nr:DUF3857 domain-containing protein [Chitinophagaceae bacterium]
MNRRLLIWVLLLAASDSFAQEFTSYGNVTNEDYNYFSCPFDPDADAVYLVKEAHSMYNDQNNLITYHHVRLKILKDKGIGMADVSIPYYSKDNFEFIDDIEGFVYNTEKDYSRKTIKLDRKTVFNTKRNTYYSEIRIPFPSVRAGSIIEYKYRSVQKSYFALEDWSFQDEIPVIKSRYFLAILPNTAFQYRVQKHPDYEIDIKQNAQNGTIEFAMQNIPGLVDEPFIDSRKDYLQQVLFQLAQYDAGGGNMKKYLNSWEEVSRELSNEEQFGRQLDKNLTGTEEIIKTWKGISDQTDRLKNVHKYVSNSMGWNGFYGKYTADGVKSAWTKKSGSIADINLILVNLLRQAGLKADPMLISERDHGRVNTSYPYLDQFNGVYAVVDIDGQKYYLDACDRITPVTLTPYSVLNTTAYVVNKKTGGIVTISDNMNIYRDSIFVKTAIGKDNVITGHAKTSSTDYARVRRLEQFRRDETKYSDKYFRPYGENLTMYDFNTVNDTTESGALQHEFNFSLPAVVTGDYLFAPVNLFSGLKTNPFSSAKRFSDINYGFRQHIYVSVEYDLPAGYSIDAAPKSIRMVTPDRSIDITRKISQPVKEKFICTFEILWNKSHFPSEEYPDVKEFYKRMFDVLNEQIVLKKIANP